MPRPTPTPTQWNFEPTFAKSADGRSFRLDYISPNVWRLALRVQDGCWTTVFEDGLQTLQSWGRDRRAAGDKRLVRELGIRVSGNFIKRLTALRPDTKLVGWGCDYVDLGGVGTAFTDLCSLGVFAEPDGLGGVMVWGACRQRFHAGESAWLVETSLQTVQDILHAVANTFSQFGQFEISEEAAADVLAVIRTNSAP